MITLEVLSTFRGHKPVYVEDPDNPEERKKLAQHVESMLKDGYDLFLIDSDRITRRVKGYDSEANEWILFGSRVPTPDIDEAGEEAEGEPERRRRGRPKKTTSPADNTTVTAVARTAGG